MSTFRSFLASIFGRRAPALAIAPAPRVTSVPQEAVNDAQAYGVAVVPATVTPGAWYWQAVRVHHLTPAENGGNHHLYLDILDPALAQEANLQGQRTFGARAKITWDGGEQLVTVDKPLNEPGANFPMWKWQICAAAALGLPGQELPSDRVTGLQTGHPDEAPGNTLFHHSFNVTFVKAQAAVVVYRDSVVYGVVRGAAGRTVTLLRGSEAVAQQPLAADGTFRFADLAAGDYAVAVEGTPLRSAPTTMDGQSQARLDLELILTESVITGRVRNGADRTVQLTRDAAEVATATVASDESYRFGGLAAGVYRVALVGTQAVSDAMTLDGANTATADLVVPGPGKPLAHYVLFGPADHPKTKANLLLAQDYLLAFTPTFGFSATEAAGAGLVTIIGGTDAVSAETEAGLAAGAATVQRIAGSPTEVAAALAQRIAAGRPF
ncbi:MAG: hypothetical protein NT169_10565 [Chloroflexi bacterium]|nr:hypothetical protein [Chloroflexota bacterium]